MNRICDECKTENEPQYEYCKNCGAHLKTTDGNNVEFTNLQYNYSQFEQENLYGDVCGVSREELSAYIFKNSDSIIKTFENMERKGNNISWCWPTAILGLLLGPIGSALWFLYRKLYLPGILLILVGIVATSLSTAVFFADFPVEIVDTLEQIYYFVDTAELGREEKALEEILTSKLEQISNYENPTASAINDITSIFCLVVSSLSAYGMYKRKVIDSITRYRANNIDPRYYKMGLTAIGGTSGGMLALGIIILIFVPSLISTILALIILI